MSESVFFQALLLVCGTVGFLGSLRFLRDFLELRHAQRIPVESNEVQQRLERLERVITPH